MTETDDHVAEMQAKWNAIGEKCGPSDTAAAIAAARDAYRLVNEVPPTRVVWCDSIREGVRQAAIERFDLHNGGGGTEPGPLPPREPSEQEIRTALGEVAYAQPDAPWLCRCDYILKYDRTGPYLADVEKVEPIVRLAEEVSWWWPYDDVMVLVGHPSAINRDANGDLHCEDGPAMAWPDGKHLYFWHGTPVPRQAVEDPDNYPITEVINEPNMEIRRAVRELLGWDRMLAGLDAKVVNTDEAGDLIRCKRRVDDEELVLVRMVNSTPEGHWEDDSGGTWFDRSGVPLNPADPSDAELIVEHHTAVTAVIEKVDRDMTTTEAASLVPASGRLPLRFTPNKRFVADPGPRGEPAPYFKQYVMRVPPTSTSALEALAWSFDMAVPEYREMLRKGHQT